MVYDNMLHALPAYNCILKLAINILLESDHQLQVRYIPSDQNSMADSISCQQFSHALTLLLNRKDGQIGD